MSNQATKISPVAVANPVSNSSALRWRFLLGLIVILAFGRICTNDFVAWDDYVTITQNAKFTHSVNWHMVALSWLPHYAERGLWMPVAQTAWAILASIGRVAVPDEMGNTLNPAIFHGASLLIHLINVLLVFEILRRIIRHNTAAAFGALLYAVHPLQVEVVAWASGLKDLLAAMFAFIAILSYMTFAERHSRRSYAISIITFILAILSKPSAMITPALIAVIDLLVLHRKPKAILKSVSPLFLIAIACVIWTKLIQPGYGIPAVPLIYRPLVMTDSLAFYFCKLIWPAQLAVDYGRRPPIALANHWLYWTWIFPVAIAILLWIFRKKAPLLILAALLFLIGVAPMLGLTRFMFQYYSGVADHYLYIAMLGPALALAWFLSRGGFAKYAIVSILLVICAIRTMIEERYWSDNLTLFTHIIDVNPNSFMAYNNRGNTYRLMGKYFDAEADLQKSVRLYPDDHISRGNLFENELALGQYFFNRGDNIQARKYLELARSLRPDDARVNDLLSKLK